MSLDEGQRQLGHLAGQLFETAVFLSPLFDLWKQVDRNVSGVGFAFDLPGQIVARVLLTPGTTAVGIAASPTGGDEAGGQNGTLSLELLLTGLKEAADQGRMFGNLHTIERAKFWPETMICIKAYQLQDRRMALRQLCSEGVCYRHPDDPCGEAKPSTGGKCRQREKARRLWGGRSSRRCPRPTPYTRARATALLSCRCENRLCHGAAALHHNKTVMSTPRPYLSARIGLREI